MHPNSEQPLKALSLEYKEKMRFNKTWATSKEKGIYLCMSTSIIMKGILQEMYRSICRPTSYLQIFAYSFLLSNHKTLSVIAAQYYVTLFSQGTFMRRECGAVV